MAIKPIIKATYTCPECKDVFFNPKDFKDHTDLPPFLKPGAIVVTTPHKRQPGHKGKVKETRQLVYVAEVGNCIASREFLGMMVGAQGVCSVHIDPKTVSKATPALIKKLMKHHNTDLDAAELGIHVGRKIFDYRMTFVKLLRKLK